MNEIIEPVKPEVITEESVTPEVIVDAVAPVAPIEPTEPVPPAVEAPTVIAVVAPSKPVRHQRKATAVNPVTATIEITTIVTDDAEPALPASVTLASPYAFYDDEGVMQSWAAGQTVEDAVVIALLVERGAIFEAA